MDGRGTEACVGSGQLHACSGLEFGDGLRRIVQVIIDQFRKHGGLRLKGCVVYISQVVGNNTELIRTVGSAQGPHIK